MHISLPESAETEHAHLPHGRWTGHENTRPSGPISQKGVLSHVRVPGKSGDGAITSLPDHDAEPRHVRYITFGLAALTMLKRSLSTGHSRAHTGHTWDGDQQPAHGAGPILSQLYPSHLLGGVTSLDLPGDDHRGSPQLAARQRSCGECQQGSARGVEVNRPTVAGVVCVLWVKHVY
jgi:hypothetical protein